jgi:hypothetical protein
MLAAMHKTPMAEISIPQTAATGPPETMTRDSEAVAAVGEFRMANERPKMASTPNRFRSIPSVLSHACSSLSTWLMLVTVILLSCNGTSLASADILSGHGGGGKVKEKEREKQGKGGEISLHR